MATLKEGAQAGRVSPTTAGASTLARYKPALDMHARKLIARIQRDHRDLDAVLALQAHYEAHGDYPSLANLLEGWADTLRDDRHAAEAYVGAADAVLRVQGDLPRAARLYGQAVERFPDHETALQLWLETLRTLGDDAGIERAYERAIAVLEQRGGEDAQCAHLHYRLGEHCELRLRSPGRAVVWYRKAVELDPTYVPAITRARHLYTAAGKHEALAEMLELEITVTHDENEQLVRLRELAELQADALGDVDAAVLTLRRALKLAPRDAGIVEQLAERLAARAQVAEGETALPDRERAAELFYQVARCVPRGEAHRPLERCVLLDATHLRAQRLLSELRRYTDEHGQPSNAHLSQAELELRETRPFLPDQQAPYLRRASGETALD